ncbi:deoxyguanosinetriphosphate triphosphohydrolase [Novosphingobium sp. RD2P27]|uniref:Deoxyguanosinetriphosphate triphosphohydrolase-like protein n=1 Tax=Novosphingobium kalidii TaxID=3230299 RepID=A0ABV2D1Z3_9SPHN
MTLAPYGTDWTRSRGREFTVENALARGPRSAYQRDRDRIIHSIAFRRLRYKTQVFVAPDGDHYRVRLTHSLEVAQIARVIARTLGLDEDLTEALALAHDIGHAPFGHAGEEALDGALHDHGGFDHNAQTLRTLMRLESPYCEHDGLNLTWETLEGLAKHNGPVAQPGWALAELDAAFSLDLGTWPSLEAQVASLSDDIAYDNHDIDDGLRAGFLDLEEVLTHPFVADHWRQVEKRYPSAPLDRKVAELIRSQIGFMVNDLIAETQKRLEGIGSVDEIRSSGRPIAAFSDELAEQERAFKRFMYEKLYYHPEQLETARRAKAVVAELFSAYSQQPVLMEENWIDGLPRHEPERSRHIADYIAGMTDRFAIARFADIYGTMPEGLSNV